MKRGQVTVFVLAGLVIIIVLSLLFTAAFEINKQYSDAKKSQFISYDYNEGFVRSQVDSCIAGLLQETIYLTASNGGYLSPHAQPLYDELGAEQSVTINLVDVPVLFNENNTYFLSKEDLEKRICSKVHVELASCFDNSSLLSSGIDITSFESTSSVAFSSQYCEAFLNNYSVLIKTNHSIFIEKGPFHTNISGFVSEKEIPLGYLLIKAEEFAEFVKDNANNSSINLSSACITHDDFSIELIDNKVVNFIYYRRTGDSFIVRFGFTGYNLNGQCS